MIQLNAVSLKAGGFSLQNIDLQVGQGEYAVLMGRTGHGKTTLLEIICGLRQPQSGQVLIDGTDVTRWPPGDRSVGYVPQDLALFPSMNVVQHLEFAPRLRGMPEDHIRTQTAELSAVLGIQHLLQRTVKNLSGGEAQRVALGRALASRPVVLLLDEPLSALDETTRETMHDLLRKVKTTTGVTTIHVTHNSREADILADRRFLMQDGRIIDVSESDEAAK
ncbi:MAG: ABC transporter ATP-binding protein [Planctomycetaceae bacterium]|nr:ABC transporter ATP-binding protein [Planctomycetaceae bacterium]